MTDPPPPARLTLPGIAAPQGNGYPKLPDIRDDETREAWTTRLLTDPDLFDHLRGRGCSLGYHSTCSNRDNTCACPHHQWVRHGAAYVRAWNVTYPIGTRVVLPAAPEEPPAKTTGLAHVLERNVPRLPLGVPVVPVAGFDHPVEMAWLLPAPEEV